MTTRYLRIHFAPNTACVDLELSEDQAAKLIEAMGKHNGDITLEVSTHHKISTGGKK